MLINAIFVFLIWTKIARFFVYFVHKQTCVPASLQFQGNPASRNGSNLKKPEKKATKKD